MILQHFSWQQFLVAALVLSLIWYVALVLALYRGQLIDYLNGRRRPAAVPEPLRHEWDEELIDEAGAGESLMGRSALPEGMSRVSMSEFGFAPLVKASARDEDRETKLGLIPDVLEELKSIFHILETEQGGKAEFISLFSLVGRKYPQVRGTANERAVNEYIREHVLFPISDEELGALWN